jgi:hypothetical protein
MTKLISIALVLAGLASPARGDKVSDLQAAASGKGCESIPAFYATERGECLELRKQSDAECKVADAKLSCDESGPVRTDTAVAESRFQKAEDGLEKAKAKKAKAKTPAEKKQADAEVDKATKDLAAAKQARQQATSSRGARKTENAATAARITKCLQIRGAARAVFGRVEDRLRTEKLDDRGKAHVRTLQGKYADEVEPHEKALRELKVALDRCQKPI